MVRSMSRRRDCPQPPVSGLQLLAVDKSLRAERRCGAHLPYPEPGPPRDQRRGAGRMIRVSVRDKDLRQ